MAELDVFYAQFMDDGIILASSRWKLRRAIRACNQVLNQLKVEQHPDKTFIGRTTRGFDFLGYQIEPAECVVSETRRPASEVVSSVPIGWLLRASQRNLKKRNARIHRLYEQGASETRIGEYLARLLKWIKSGLHHFQMLLLVDALDELQSQSRPPSTATSGSLVQVPLL